jgi:hypothetical protein
MHSLLHAKNPGIAPGFHCRAGFASEDQHQQADHDQQTNQKDNAHGSADNFQHARSPSGSYRDNAEQTDLIRRTS